MNYYDTIIECVVMPALNAAKPVGAKPLPANRLYPRHQQDEDEEEGDITEIESNNVKWNMFHSGRLTPDQEERYHANINRSANASPTPSSVSRLDQRNGDCELASDHHHHHHHQQNYQRQGMGRHKFSRLSAGGKVINRSLALNSATFRMKQGKAAWRQLGTEVRSRRNATEDYEVIKYVCRSVGERPEGMYEEQNLIRQELHRR
ncbi:hypothetical protein EC957_008250 [Mortierella hygrophila]|uniref:Uncharacterized protein n=1 Tax=Mortierella hygrophila TaxID=979708 RepID=A0A9P6FDC7_9FUNG|nr:hypothetical protein EC957_008250 [Mortierella hygrophila]